MGGDRGLLKVLEVDPPRPSGGVKLTLLQSLGLHEEKRVTIAAWNPLRGKLATCDETGAIVVWIRHEARRDGGWGRRGGATWRRPEPGS